MRKLVWLTIFALMAATIVSCSGKKPGISVGSMTVREHSLMPLVSELPTYCNNYYDFDKEPGTQTFECEVPSTSTIRIGFGWTAKDADQLDSNWNAMTWELYIDEVQISLDGFEQSDYSGGKDSAGNQVKARVWTLDLVDPSPGKHTLRLLWKSETPIDNGIDIYAPGTHENIVNFTVLDK